MEREMPATIALSSFAGLAFAAPGLAVAAGTMLATGPQSGMYACSTPSCELTTLGVSMPKSAPSAALRLPQADVLATVELRPLAA